MATPVNGEVKVSPPSERGYEGNPQGPTIDTAYDLAKIIEVRFSKDNIYKVQAGVPFNVALNLRLLEAHLEDGEILRNLFVGCGQSASTYLDIGFQNGTGAIFSVTSNALCFADVPDLFTQKGYDYVARNEVLHGGGNYNVLARVRRNAEPNDFRLGSAGVSHHPLEVILDGSVPVVAKNSQQVRTPLKKITYEQLEDFKRRQSQVQKPKKSWWHLW